MESKDITSAKRHTVKNSEKYLEKAHQAHVAAEGGLTVKLIAGSITGLPDRLILWPGGVAEFIEFKTKGAKPSRIQKIVHNRLRALGFAVWVLDSFDSLNIWKSSSLGRTRRK